MKKIILYFTLILSVFVYMGCEKDEITTVVNNCGNDKLDTGEECDDGNTNNNDGCSSVCKYEKCGDGVLQEDETCDDGGESADCDSDCTASACGDGVINAAAGEDCDDAGESAECNNNCTLPVCGDGVKNASTNEGCDDGNTTAGDNCDDICRKEVTAPSCGNGIVEVTAGGNEETCDDGNTTSDDGCSSSCWLEFCGDGYVQTGEECDGDGAGTAGETLYCDSDCTFASCGDTVTNAAANEGCDDGGIIPGDGCDDICRLEVTSTTCGNGVVEVVVGGVTETCDDGNTTAGDGCDELCSSEPVEVFYGNYTPFNGPISSWIPGYIVAQKVTLSAGMILTDIGMIINQASTTRVKLALYSDVSGTATNMVADTSIFTATLGDHMQPINQGSVNLNAGDYWIAFIYSDTTLNPDTDGGNTSTYIYIAQSIDVATPSVFPASYFTYTAGQSLNLYIHGLQ
ncbi:MAG: DUF4215 domain-containing protein [Spirochaetia bacterium]|nr:DUF4215 domain-containing protein [Spirochaetia bacterium]